MLLRLSYLAVSSVFTLIGLLPVSDIEKDIEILALRHQLAILQRQIDRPWSIGTDRVFLNRGDLRIGAGLNLRAVRLRQP